MHVGGQQPLVEWLPNMHGRHSEPEKGPSIIFPKVSGLLLGDHTCAGATSSPWPTVTAFVVAVGHCDGDLQA